MARKTIDVGYLARVEGEGGVRITFDGNTVRDVELRIFEPPRFFEAFLRGRAYTERPTSQRASAASVRWPTR